MYENKNINKTIRFLVPAFKKYGNEFIKYFNSLNILRIGVYDNLLENNNMYKGENIFVKHLKSPYKFDENKDFYEFLENKEYFIGKYCPDIDVVSSLKEVIVIKFPSIYKNAYKEFMCGAYSKMYSETELDFIFNSVKNVKFFKKNYEILSKTNKENLIEFVNILNKEYGGNFSEEDISKESEWELPPKMSEEVFNYELDTKFYTDLSLYKAITKK